jgi:hypothetical protein
MARLASVYDERGAVYVEFLLAFPTIFLLFLALCQFALIAVAEAVVRHSAYMAVRSAIVVLEDAPARYDGAERGILSKGEARQVEGADKVLAKLAIGDGTAVDWRSALERLEDVFEAQAGARMVPIKTAAYLPLLPLAPTADFGLTPPDSLANTLGAATERQLRFALEYTKVAATVTLHDSEVELGLAVEPIGAKSSVTARISYPFHCAVPLVRVLMCRSLDGLARERPSLVQAVERTRRLVAEGERFKLITAFATLPNQGAAYYQGEGR